MSDLKLDHEPLLRLLGTDESERNLVLSGWLRTYIGTHERPGPVQLGIPRGVLMRLYGPLVKDVIRRSCVVLACLPDMPERVYGWLCIEGDVIHYVCVKPRWQRLGIGSWLIDEFRARAMTYTHLTPDGKRLKMPETWKYDGMPMFDTQEVAA